MMYANGQNREAVHSLLVNFQTNDAMSISLQKELLERTYSLLLNPDSEDYNLALAVICHTAERLPTDLLLRQILVECIVQSRVFLYARMIGDSSVARIHDSFLNDFAEENYCVPKTGTTLTRDQKFLLDKFVTTGRLVVSAPTSFGKSRLMDEIIRIKDYDNILIILPTIALLAETFSRLKQTNGISDRYRLTNSLGGNDSAYEPRGNLFILTPEKTELLLDAHTYLKFDFFIIDEVYKIHDAQDERSRVFTNCLYRMSRFDGISFYLIGPYFEGFSEKFLAKTGATFLRFTSEIVQKKVHSLDGLPAGKKVQLGGVTFEKKKDVKQDLKSLIPQLNGQTIVYRGAKRHYTEATANYVATFSETVEDTELVKYLQETISPDWSLITCLKHGVAFHHGALPKYIQTELIEAFNAGKLKTLVCTSTIIEGVNTTAKNVVLFDNQKGDDPLTGFDVKNIKGRAGRLTKHFVGNVFGLVPLTPDHNREIIEFAYFDSDSLAPEDLIQIDSSDLTERDRDRQTRLEREFQRLEIPIDLLRKNRYIPIHKQISLVLALRGDLFRLRDLAFSSSLPDKDQLDQILQLCHNHLFSERDANDRSYTIGQLIRLTKFYVYKRPSVKELIREYEEASNNLDTRIRNTFVLISTYFEFKIPKYLAVFETLFNLVCAERAMQSLKIDLRYLIMLLEFGYSEAHEISLKEAGVPTDIIRKIGSRFSDCSTITQVRLKYGLIKDDLTEVSEFERNILSRYL